MGYYTYYKMGVHQYGPNDKPVDIMQWLSDYMKKEQEAFYPFESVIDDVLDACKDNPDYVPEVFEPDDSCKWYDHDDEMKALSLAFPETVFKLHGDGEESGDNWDAYYKNGKSVVYTATIPPLNPADLE